ncbi:MAG: DNA-directed RNA polymerase subunit beta', partial [Lachnospiraceae bacterium]|nr:DNA-directed RNA polymerase subunit beta' [Lachnospiraceae bacterium]
FDVLDEVIKEHPVMLNRAPTLHRLGIQAFEPILVEGKAIKLHPLVCTAYNADFDGDQMAVHLPLSVEAQAECRFLMLSTNNLLKPSDGGPVAVPSQDMVLGIYYLTQEREGAKGEGNSFKDVNEAILAYENGYLDLHARIYVDVEKKKEDGTLLRGTVSSTLGRFIFNEIIEQDLGFVDRSIPENELLPEIDFLVGKKELKQILQNVINVHGTFETAETLDKIKAIGYKYSTRAAMTVSISDITVPPEKQQMIKDAEARVDRINMNFRRGFSTEEERYKEVKTVWENTDDELTRALLAGMDKYNNIYMMANSGARGSDKQIKQLAGMRGLMSDTVGRVIELPIKSNFREGLDILEYFISAHGARKGLSDTALRTADSGYLTRRLVDVSQDLIIREMDCSHDGEIPYMEVSAFRDGNENIESLKDRLIGRTLAEDIVDETTGEVIAEKNQLIKVGLANRIIASGRTTVKIRNVLACRSHLGVCAKCYGANLATGEQVQVGEAIGIIAAQSIGEPGTQLTMRTFHTGGVAGDNITKGLPRVEELFEARKPKGLAIISEIEGEAAIRDTKKKREVVITDTETGENRVYVIPYGSHIKVEEGQHIQPGDELTEGSINPHDLLRIKGVRAVQDYILREVLRVYRIQGVDINDKHIEVIVRQMLKKVRIEDPGDTGLLTGTVMNVLDLEDINDQMLAEDKTPATFERIILGITKASLATNSFLSAASFQETTKVLTEAAINGKIDPLIGLKENVLIGKLIPAGTGMKKYRSVVLDTDGSDLMELKAKAQAELAEAEAAEEEMSFEEDEMEGVEEAEEFETEASEDEFEMEFEEESAEEEAAEEEGAEEE